MRQGLLINPQPSRYRGSQLKAAGDAQGTVSPTLVPDFSLHTLVNLFVFCRALSKLVLGILPGRLGTTSAKPLGWRWLCLTPVLQHWKRQLIAGGKYS